MNYFSKYFELILKISSYLFLLLILLIVIEDLPIRNYFIDPAVNIIKYNPNLCAYLLLIGCILFVLKEGLGLYYLFKNKGDKEYKSK